MNVRPPRGAGSSGFPAAAGAVPLCAALVLLGHVALAGAAPGPRPQVIGGASIGATDVPPVGALVRLTPDGARHYVCTGTLVSGSVVVTAAHCLKPGHDLVFALGEDPLLQTRDHAVVWALQHAAFRIDGSSVEHDIGLVGLYAPVEAVRPVMLPSRPPEPGDAVRLVGYGSTTLARGPERSLNSATATVTAVEKEEIRIGDADSIQSCTGDSGGPALAVAEEGEPTIVAVTSRGAQPASPCTGGGIHTRVDAHLDFIHDGPLLFADADGAEACAVRSTPGSRCTRRSCAWLFFMLLGAWGLDGRRSPKGCRARESNPDSLECRCSGVRPSARPSGATCRFPPPGGMGGHGAVARGSRPTCRRS